MRHHTRKMTSVIKPDIIQKERKRDKRLGESPVLREAVVLRRFSQWEIALLLVTVSTTLVECYESAKYEQPEPIQTLLPVILGPPHYTILPLFYSSS